MKFVIPAFKRTKRISQPGLSNKLQHSLAYPLSDIDLLRTIRRHGLKFFPKLQAGSLKHKPQICASMYLSYDCIKNGHHVSHMVDVEDRVQYFSLLTMLITWR